MATQPDYIVISRVNPTTVSHRDQDLQLVDGSRPIATVHRTMTVYP